MESTEATDGGRRLDSARTVSTNITSLKNKRAAVKRRITNTLKKLESTIEQYGRKAIIRGYVNNLQEYLNEAKGLNDKLISVIPETEHEATLDWYEEQLERVEDAKLQANAHLDERAEESSSGLSSVKSCKTSTTRTLSQAAEIRAKMTSAEIKAKQLALEEQRRTVEFEKQLEVKRKLELVQDEAQRLKFMAQERRKTQEAKDEAARLAAEAAILEKVQNTVNDPETLSNRLLDFVDDSLKFIPSSIPDEPLPIVPQPPPGLLQEAGANDGTVLPTNNTTEAVTPSLLLQHPKSAISFKTPKVMEKSKETLPLYHSWIGDLQSGVQHPPLTSTDNRKTTICGHPTRDSLPKLRLSKFDGDPLHWSDWSSMFKSIVHDANLSLNGKMQHLQNSVIGKAKSAIEGYGYSGDSYYEALKELETRFGKPSLVVKVTLDKLKKTARLQNDKPQEVRNLSDVVSTTVWTFKKFGYESDLKAEANVSLAVDKLSQELKIKWKDNTKTTNLERPSLVDFSVWLKGQADIYDDCCYPSKFPSRPNKNKTGGSNGLNERQNTFSSNLSPHPKTTKFSCIMCDGQEHKLSSCPRFKVLSVEERLNEVQKHKLCFSCFSPKHWFSNCSNKKQCGVNGCTRSHNALLHNLRNVSSVESSDAVSAINPEAQAEVGLSTEHSNTSHRSSHTSVLLQVVPVTLYGPKGYFNTYAMLDTGSTCSLLLADVARRLGLDGPLESVVLNGIQKTSELVTKRVNVQVSQVNDFGTQFDVNGVLVVDHLNVPEKKVKLKELQERWPHLSDLELTEVAGTQVTLLLGSDVPELIVPLETRHGPKGSPVGVRTGIGWTVTGRLPGHIQECESVCKVHVATPDEELNETVKTWWRTENFGCRYDNDTQRSVEDERVMKFLDENTRKVDGRYEVPLIWRDDKVELPDNFAAAAQRLNFLEKKLNRNPELAERYRKTIDMDMEKGYIKRLTKEETTAPVMRKWYLPHHPVLNPKKPEKVRRVCDAAAKFCPDLLNNLVGIFMRFREEKVALSGDIEAMFNQVAVPEEDQACLRFLWRQSPDLPTEVYQYVRHIFGAKCAPTCSNYALLRSAEDNEKQFPSAALAVKRNFYMDDFFKSVKSSDEALELQKELVEMLNEAAFHLTKWISNEKEVIEQIPESERAPSVKVVEESIVMSMERALGVVWDTSSDCFVYEVVKRDIADMRRKILNLIASLFDPIGFIAPFLVRAKIFLQQVWQLGIGWDDALPPEFLKEWSKWQEQLGGISQIQFPRFYRHIPDNPSVIDLHVFGDASEQAFCAVAYFRFCYASGAVRCAFVTAKTRVAPKKPLSIPRLELQAAVLSARLATVVIKEHDYIIDSTYYWTDSSTVFQWIRGVSKRHPAFIANRIGEILDSTEPNHWNHCPGQLNPADDGSRGLPVSSITSGSRWVNGPAFLHLPEERWPKGNAKLEIPKPSVDDPQAEEMAVTWTGVVKDSRNDFLSPAKYSSLIKLLKVTAYLIRFIYNCKHPKSERRIGSLMVEEMEQARKFWICVAQAESFPQEVAVLKLKHHVSSKSKLVSLSPFLDEHGIIRAGGRIERADIPFCSRHPVVLAPDHELTRLIIMNCHEKLKHEGVDHVRNELRQQYWILRCRATVRKILHQCSYCRRRKAKPEAPLMASLPYDRLSVAPPFSKVGVDFFGPLKVKHLRKQEKRYGCLFTCLVTRAVHLEVAFSLSTDSFIMCLRRFMARRGKPTVIYSDNGTNFVGANNELRECIDDWNQHKIGSVLSQEGIQWVFNPPAAPHMGGVWERLVRSCKKALNVVLQNQVLTDEVLQTAFAEVEWVVNSRPLTQVTSDLDDLEALTPNHFLIGRGSLNLPPGIFVDKEISSRKRWRQAQVIANHIWNRWLREYLPGLITRKKWTQPTVNVKVGDLVLVVDRAASRGSWPLGRIVKVFPGLDSIVRSADVKTKFGVMRRPVTKLAVLEECSTN